MSSKVQVDAPRLWLVLSRCHRALSQIAERSIEEAGLGLTDFAALEALLHKGPLTIAEIQGKVPLAIGSMTAAVDRLEKKGLIMRTPASGDRRAKVLKLTTEGRRIVEKAFSRHAAELESAMAVLNASEKRQLHVLLKKLGLFAAGAAAETRSQGDKYVIEPRTNRQSKHSIARELQEFAVGVRSAETKEAITAFFEKRPPEFSRTKQAQTRLMAS